MACLRALQATTEGVTTEPTVDFGGQRYQLRRRGALLPLLNFAAAGHHPRRGLVVLHGLLAACLEPASFASFETAALAGKAQLADVTAVAERAVEFYCARPFLAAIRLLAWVAENIAEVEASLLRSSGRDLGSLDARQACNLALVLLLDGRDEEERAEFLADLAASEDPEKEAADRALAMISAARGE